MEDWLPQSDFEISSFVTLYQSDSVIILRLTTHQALLSETNKTDSFSGFNNNSKSV